MAARTGQVGVLHAGSPSAKPTAGKADCRTSSLLCCQSTTRAALDTTMPRVSRVRQPLYLIGGIQYRAPVSRVASKACHHSQHGHIKLLLYALRSFAVVHIERNPSEVVIIVWMLTHVVRVPRYVGRASFTGVKENALVVVARYRIMLAAPDETMPARLVVAKFARRNSTAHLRWTFRLFCATFDDFGLNVRHTAWCRLAAAAYAASVRNISCAAVVFRVASVAAISDCVLIVRTLPRYELMKTYRTVRMQVLGVSARCLRSARALWNGAIRRLLEVADSALPRLTVWQYSLTHYRRSPR